MEKKNYLLRLQEENGDTQGDDKIAEHATQYNKSLFGPTSKPMGHGSHGP